MNAYHDLYEKTRNTIAAARENQLADAMREITRLREEVALWKERCESAEQALDATIKDCNRALQDRLTPC